MANRTYELGSREIPDNDMWDMCDHLEAGDTAKAVYCEDDRFGPVGRMAVCDDCHAERNELSKAINSAVGKCAADMVKKSVHDKTLFIDLLDEPLGDVDFCIDDDDDLYESDWR